MYEQYAMENIDNDTDLRIDVELIDKCLHRLKTHKAVIPLLCGCCQFYTMRYYGMVMYRLIFAMVLLFR